ncbi:MAG: tyrosine--tRNA ligase [Flavobacteriaceae bacterium]|nr:MAG: tyrosine--tRNA ligase [Flavobacteriaceae bacterium]
MNPFLEELSQRGLLSNHTPGVESQLSSLTTGYIGFDPTADSLHVGSLVPILLLVHLQRHGHKPIALIGGATGMIGDPSGKSAERNLLDEQTLAKNVSGIKAQLERFLDFESGEKNAAILVNNYDWMKDFSFIDFARDIGKHITVNYMMAKESVKKRVGEDSKTGMSFTEFTYQLFQGYDFVHLYKTLGCTLQMGGSDQWGNMTTGTELVRRILGGEAHALTCPLTTKADGTKFGKSEGGENIWLDLNRTSAYKFYQFWLNQTDADAEKYIKIYTFLPLDEIEKLILVHGEAPHQRLLQKTLAKEITLWVHGESQLEMALKASEILFGKSSLEDLKSLDTDTFLSVFEGVPTFEIPKEELEKNPNALELLAQTTFFQSKSEIKRALEENSLSLNQEKIGLESQIGTDDLLNHRYLLLRKGKKSYFLISVKNS